MQIHIPYSVQFSFSSFFVPFLNVLYVQEELEIDYRHFDANNIAPRFEFGFGLSYSCVSVFVDESTYWCELKGVHMLWSFCKSGWRIRTSQT